MYLHRSLLGAAAALLLAAPSASAGFLSTTSDWNGSNVIGPFGRSNTATYGQTFTANHSLLGTQLDSFSFFLGNVLTSNTQFTAHVAAWNGSRADGPILYSSAPQFIPVGSPGFTKFTFNTGGVSLTDGAVYVAFLTASGLGSNGNTTTSLGYISSPTAYAGGQFTFLNSGTDFSALTTTNWTNFSGDLAFEMSFSSSSSSSSVATPEPASLAGLSLATLLVGGLRRRRKPDPTIA